MPPYRQMVYLLLWQTAPRVVGDADPYNSRYGPGMPGPQLRGSNPFTGNHTNPRAGHTRPIPCGKKKACAFLCTRSFLMSQYVVIVVPTK